MLLGHVFNVLENNDAKFLKVLMITVDTIKMNDDNVVIELVFNQVALTIPTSYKRQWCLPFAISDITETCKRLHLTEPQVSFSILRTLQYCFCTCISEYFRWRDCDLPQADLVWQPYTVTRPSLLRWPVEPLCLQREHYPPTMLSPSFTSVKPTKIRSNAMRVLLEICMFQFCLYLLNNNSTHASAVAWDSLGVAGS